MRERGIMLEHESDARQYLIALLYEAVPRVSSVTRPIAPSAVTKPPDLQTDASHAAGRAI